MSTRKRHCQRTEDPSEENASLDNVGGVLSGKIESATLWCRSRPDPSVLCPHCDTLLSTKTYKKHKRLYYDSEAYTWQKLDSEEFCTSSLEVMITSDDPPPELPCELMPGIALPPELLTELQSDYEVNEGAESLDKPTQCQIQATSVAGSDPEPNESLGSESDLEELWEDDDFEPLTISGDADIAPALPDQCEPHHDMQQQSAMAGWLLGFLLRLQAKHYISDSALEALIKFLYAFFVVLSPFSNVVASILRIFPRSLHMLKKSLGYSTDFVEYVVCRKCYHLYNYQECVAITGSNHSTKQCSFIEYPNHPWQSGRTPCGTSLLRSVHVRSGKRILYPFKVYCYRNLLASLQELLLRPKFYDSCQNWRKRVVSQNLCDLYDGNIWKEFTHFDGQHFLALSTSLAFILNVDWFQPYTHTVLSIGVIYLTVMNLPRFMRFKRENVIIIGIIPGPTEPSHDINPFLKPLVEELLLLWTGVDMTVRSGAATIQKNIRGALLCCSCDLPAGRKACGFLGHNATLGCSRCLKKFPGDIRAKDYSGFDQSLWELRTKEKHRADIKLFACRTKTDRAKIESEIGCRYTAFLELPYFDPPRMLIVDPMHNLFLGTAKKMISIWLEQNTISSRDFLQLQSLVDSFHVPSDIGRIPTKIATAFSGFTADQYKNWVLIFSIPCLFGILPSTHLECWRHFVLACRLICKWDLSQTDITLVNALLVQFCRKVEVLYGPSVVTPNMHMHGHLKEVLQDFGPVYEFWLFPFERYNGILGNQPSNNRAIEPQLLRRFLRDNCAYSYQFPDEFKEDFQGLIPQESIVGSCKDTCSPEGAMECVLPSRCHQSVFDSDDLCVLKKVYGKLHDCNPQDVFACTVFMKYSSITLGSRTYHSTGKNSVKPCIAMAFWDSELLGRSTSLPDLEHPMANIRPVNILYFAKASFQHETNSNTLVLACVSWYSPHPNRHIIGKPAEVWCPDLHEPFGTHSFLPLKYIKSRCTYCKKLVNDENVLVVIPLVER